MNKNPFFNALAAALYIVLIVFTIDMFSSASSMPKETILIPITMLSLFVLSAAVMGYLFIYEPLRLHLDNQRREAMIFFAKTVGTFACFVALFLGILLYTSLI